MTKRPNSQDEALIIACLTGQATDAQRRDFDTRLASDANFASQVDAIENWLAPLDVEVDHVDPPAELLGQIMAQIAQESGAGQTYNVTPIAAANDASSVKFWRGAAIAASMIAVASLGLHIVPDEAPTTIAETPIAEPDAPSSLLALLSGDNPSPLVAIFYNPETGQVVARFSNVDMPDEGDLQLWLIRDGAEGPVSLGLLERSDDGQAEIESPEVLNPGVDTLAVSLEAPGGSRSAGPEGPILFTGPVTPL